MRTSIATVCLSGGLSEKVEAIAAAGFRGVEIFESDLLSSNRTPADVAKEVTELGLKVVTFQPFRDFEGMPEAQRSRTFDRAERKFDIMQQLGCDLLMVCSNVSPDALGGIVAPRQTFMSSGSARKSAAYGSVSRLWRGAVTSTITEMRGRWSAAPIIVRLASCSTRFISTHAKQT